ncbi:MAG: hypothetical protein AB7V46_15190 [Thermomicrobiales bacterium]
MKAVRMWRSGLCALLVVIVMGGLSTFPSSALATEYDLAVVGKRSGALAAIAAWMAGAKNIAVLDAVEHDTDPRIFVLRPITETNLESLGFTNDEAHGFTEVTSLPKYVQPALLGGKRFIPEVNRAEANDEAPSAPSFDIARAITGTPSAMISAIDFGKEVLDILGRLPEVTVGLGHKVTNIESTPEETRLTVITPEGSTKTLTAKMAVVAEGPNGRLAGKFGRTPFEYDKTKIMMGASFPLDGKHNARWRGVIQRVDGGFAPATRSFVFGATAAQRAGILAEVPPAIGAATIASPEAQTKFAKQVGKALGLKGELVGTPFVAHLSYSDMGDPMLKPNVVLVGGQNVHPASGLGFNGIVAEALAFGQYYDDLKNADSSKVAEYKNVVRHNHRLLFEQSVFEFGSGHHKPLLKRSLLTRLRR